jgi:hypothetical protein
MPMAGVAGRRARQDPIGEVRMKRGRKEWFNDFPRIMKRWPEAVSEIVIETTEELGRYAAMIAPEQGQSRGRPHGSWNGRPDVAPGTLKRSMKTRYYRRRGTDITLTGRVDFKAKDPTAKEPNHSFAKAVEVGSVRTNRSIGKGAGHYSIPEDPFLVPAVVVERPLFVERLKGLEDRLR